MSRCEGVSLMGVSGLILSHFPSLFSSLLSSVSRCVYGGFFLGLPTTDWQGMGVMEMEWWSWVAGAWVEVGKVLVVVRRV